MTDVVMSFDSSKFSKYKSNYNKTLVALEAAQVLLNSANIGVTPEEINILFKGRFLDDAMRETAAFRYKDEPDPFKADTFADGYYEALADYLYGFRRQHKVIDASIPFKIKADSIQEPKGWLEKKEEECRTYFTKEGLALWKKHQEAVKALNEVYQELRPVNKNIWNYTFSADKLYFRENGELKPRRPWNYK